MPAHRSKQPEHPERHSRGTHIEWLNIAALESPPHAQRDFIPSWGAELLAKFKLEAIGFLVVSHRGGRYFLIDGQHRRWCLLELGFGGADTVLCEVYEGLDEQDEALLFLQLNTTKTVNAMETFTKGVAAGLADETAINSIVRTQGLIIGKHRDGAVSCVGTLRRIYRRSGAPGVARSLAILRDAYGQPGLLAPVIDGLSLTIQRYDRALADEKMVVALQKALGGVLGLLGEAEKTRIGMRQPQNQCVAAQAVVVYNRGKRGKDLLPSWWKL